MCERSLGFLVPRLILVHIFGPRKDEACRRLFVFRRGISNIIYYYTYYEGCSMLFIYDGTFPFRYLKTLVAIQDSNLSETGSLCIFLKLVVNLNNAVSFGAVRSLRFKRETGNHDVHPDQNRVELKYYTAIFSV